MTIRRLLIASLSAAFFAAPVARADVWDEGPDADNACAAISDNELLPGSVQVHDLGALAGGQVDQDFFSVYSPPFASFEAVIDGTTGDLNNGGTPNFEFVRYSAANCGSVQEFQPASVYGFARRIAWQTGSFGLQGGLRVGSAACGAACTAADQYQIRLYETTYTIPRFNNSGTQSTVLIVQNASTEVVQVVFFFFDGDGAGLGSVGIALEPRATRVLPTSNFAFLQGKSGSVIVTNDAPYGALDGKAVALEASTGFTFDTPMRPRPR